MIRDFLDDAADDIKSVEMPPCIRKVNSTYKAHLILLGHSAYRTPKNEPVLKSVLFQSKPAAPAQKGVLIDGS